MEPTESKLDSRLRAAVHRVVDRAMSDVDVEADLAHVRERADDTARFVVAVRGRPARRQVAAVAAAAVLLVVGIVAMVATGGDDQIEVTGPSSAVRIATTTVTPTTSAVSLPAAETTTPDTTVTSERQLAAAVADPAVATPLQLITITPSEPVVFCFMSQITVAVPDGSVLRQVGLVGADGSFTPTDTPAVACDGAPPLDSSFSFRAPVDLAAGDYVACLSGVDVPAGCGPVSIRSWPEECFTEPIAPPGLIDGSAAGEPSISSLRARPAPLRRPRRW